MAADDVAAAVVDAALSPAKGMVEVAGPESFQLDQLVRIYLTARNDRKEVITDPDARYFGIKLNDRSLTPEADARLGAITFDAWLNRDKSAAA